MWVLQDRGVHTALHYLDDFRILGSQEKPACRRALLTTLALCEELGFQVAEDKTEGPTTSLSFLAIEINTQQQQIRLPQDKLSRLSTTIATWIRSSLSPESQRCGGGQPHQSVSGPASIKTEQDRPLLSGHGNLHGPVRC